MSTPGRAPDGAATRIVMRTVFPTKQLRDEAVEKYHAIEGGRQTLTVGKWAERFQLECWCRAMR